MAVSIRTPLNPEAYCMVQGLSDPAFFDATATKTEKKGRRPTRVGLFLPPTRKNVCAEVALSFPEEFRAGLGALAAVSAQA